MRAPFKLSVHSGVAPDVEVTSVRRALSEGRVPPFLHYQGAAQAARWRRLSETWSPMAVDPAYRLTLDECLGEVAGMLAQTPPAIIGLGCGTAEKEAVLIGQTRSRVNEPHFVPVDVSLPLVIQATRRAEELLEPSRIHPLLAALERASDLHEWLDTILPTGMPRLFTCFSLLPNFAPGALPKLLRGWLQPTDRVLLTANLAPGNDFESGMATILPQYDNAETRDWLLTVLEQGGVQRDDGALAFMVEAVESAPEVRRVVGRWRFARSTELHLLAERHSFCRGDELELFFSCRYQSASLREHLQGHGLLLEKSWLTGNGEEAFCLCRLA